MFLYHSLSYLYLVSAVEDYPQEGLKSVAVSLPVTGKKIDRQTSR